MAKIAAHNIVADIEDRDRNYEYASSSRGGHYHEELPFLKFMVYV